MINALRRLAIIATCVVTGPSLAEPSYTILEFSDLRGWAEDDHGEALTVFQETCRDLNDPDWTSLCAVAATQANPQTFFELFFRPVLIEDGKPGLFTGYFEPELKGSRQRTGPYQFPIYRLPPEVTPGNRWLTRRQIEESGVLRNRGLEIAWINDPVDVFFLQIQGSGRVRLTDGSVLRVGYGGKNGHTYRSVGREMIRRGLMDQHSASAQSIRAWVRRNPVAGAELLRHNDSFVFFREVNEVPADRGPLGAMNRSITAMRSIAIDPAFTPLGAPVWIEKGGRDPLTRLMIAQDTGSAIKGAQRADIFFGTGADAGDRAGTIKDPGRLIVLLPIQRAYALLPAEAG